jgi:hypothetical protein
LHTPIQVNENGELVTVLSPEDASGDGGDGRGGGGRGGGGAGAPSPPVADGAMLDK